MAGPTAARSAALDVMRAVRNGALADNAFAKAARTVTPRDRAFAQELVYGTLRLRGRIDYILAGLSTRPLEQLDPDILDVLRLGAYQLEHMDGVPAYAAVSQSVDLSRRTSARGAAGFVNGVLQNWRRRASQITFPSFDDAPIEHLSTYGSHPRWLVERWVTQFGAENARQLIALNNERPQLYLRLLRARGAASAQLDAAGIAYETQSFDDRSVAIDASDVARSLEHAPVIVQDPAASMVAAFVDAPIDACIVDVAAAPGGKAMVLATDAQKPPAFVVAADVSWHRLQRVRQNATRLSRAAPAGLGPLPLGMVVADGRAPAFRPGDVVLLDAPCTGTGTLRRHPDGRWRLRPDDVSTLAALQAQLLDAAASIVARGGLLVYATCSLEPEENEVQVESFLNRHAEFVLEKADSGYAVQDGMLRVLPQVHGYDGAFAARLRRVR